MPDRDGNPYYTDDEQIAGLIQAIAMDGFEGTREEREIRAEAWWWGTWPDDKCPTLEQAREFLAARDAERRAMA